MDPQLAIDLCRNSIWTALLITMPVLLAGITIGMIIGLFQALTQIQEQTIAIVLKIFVMVMVGSFLFPWIVIKMMEYTSDLYTNIPDYIVPYL